MKKCYIVLHIVEWDDLLQGRGITIRHGGIGCCPIYPNLRKAKRDWPGVEIITIYYERAPK